MQAISNLQTAPLYVQLADLLRQEVERGVLRRGEPIPTEAELCRLYEISRATVRQALGLLVDEGLIVRRRGRASFVAPVPPAAYAVTELRGFLETLVAQGLAPRAELLRFEMVSAGDDVTRRLELIEGARALHFERLILVEEMPMLLDSGYIPEDLALGLTPAQLGEGPIYRLLESSTGAVIAGVRQTIGATAADVRESELLQVEAGAPLLRVTRLAYVMRGRPLFYGVGRFRADRYQERLWLRRPGAPAPALTLLAGPDEDSARVSPAEP